MMTLRQIRHFIAVAETGVIGVPMPMGSVLQGIEAAAGNLAADHADVFAEAITRIDDALDGGAYEGLLEAMLAHADARWGKGLPLPPLSFLVSA